MKASTHPLTHSDRLVVMAAAQEEGSRVEFGERRLTCAQPFRFLSE